MRLRAWVTGGVLIASAFVATWAGSQASGASGCRIVRGNAPPDLANVVVSAADGRTLYASTDQETLYASNDGGMTWQIRTRRLPGWVLATFATDPETLVASPAQGLYTSVDGGHAWSPVLCGAEVAAISGTPNGRTIYVAAIEDFQTGQGGGLYWTTDGGSTWTSDTNLPYGNLNVNAVLVDPTDPRTIFVGTETGGLLRSTDAGKHWRWRQLGKPTLGLSRGAQVTYFASSPLMPNTVWAGTREQGVFESTNGGISWQPRGLHGYFIDSLTIDPVHPERVYASGGLVTLERSTTSPHGMYVRSAGRWKKIRQIPDGWTLVVASKSDVVYAWHGRTIRESNDAGRTWSTLPKAP